MNLILIIPIAVRLGLLFLAGLFLGRLINRGIYSLAWNRRELGPWSAAPADAPPREKADTWPLVGWWRLRRESAWHGRGYWIRPMLLELGTGIAVAVLYYLEIEQRLLWMSSTPQHRPDLWVLHAQYLSHVVLISLMLVATFIDFDEQTIPDEITVTGAVVGLLLAVAIPCSLLPTAAASAVGAASWHHVVVTSSTISVHWEDGLGGACSWPPSLNQLSGLGWVLAGVWGWCFAIMHKTWITRHGLLKAVRYLVASIVRRKTWVVPLLIGTFLSLVVLVSWWWGGRGAGAGAERWQSLVSAVAGMCFGGGLIWAVRVIAGEALQVEAMGFGDVTLMAMIGAFLGWQASFLVFFLAPFTAVAIALVQRILTGNPRIAFGPYLCFSAVLVLLGWDVIWNHWARMMFANGWLIPAVLVCLLLMMGFLLWIWRSIREAFF